MTTGWGPRSEADDGESDRLAAHDLLQSVSIIQSILGAVGADDAFSSRFSAELALLESEVHAMATICERSMAGPAIVERVNLGAVAAHAAERMAVLYPGEIDVEVDAEEQTIVGDPVEWDQALLNLLENAGRAAGPAGKVKVHCYRDGTTIRCSVEDTGRGFGEAPAGRSSIGLVAVTRLADRHGGHLELRRSPLGGAQLTIVVPVVVDSSEAQA